MRAHRYEQRACLSGGTSNWSALAGGCPFFAGKMHGTFVNIVIYNMFCPRQPPPVFELQLSGKDCDKQNVDSRFSLALVCNLIP